MSTLFDLSEDIKQLRSAFRENGSGVTMNAEAVGTLLDRLAKMQADARALECEVSRYRWNEMAAAERGPSAEVLAACAASDSNIRLFPGVRALLAKEGEA